ncbi:MAG: InlB B-repeat-containing protein [Fibrobacter sp.]|nr:InlB B-repeat-containing protein [Fibrobacter sp.]
MSSRFLFSISAVLLAGTAATAATITPVVPIQSDGCYQISTAEELYGFAEIVNGNDSTPGIGSICGELLNDIVVNENVLNKSGWLNSESADTLAVWKPLVGFSGTFNGNGHVISGLYSATKSGLFETIVSEDSVVVVRDLGIVDSYFSPASTAGVLANNISGRAKVQITNFYTLSTIETRTRDPYMGVITANFSSYTHLTVTNCYNAGLLVDNKDRFYSGFFGSGVSGYRNINVSNSYTLKQKGVSYVPYGTLVDSAAFSNGAVAYALREGEDGSIWGQNVGTDKYPVFSGSLVNSAAARYNVTFHTFVGDTVSYFDSYISGFNVVLPKNVEQENMYFDGWYRDSEFSGTPDTVISDTAKGDLEYWAKMNRIYKITYHADGAVFSLYRQECILDDYVPMEENTDCYISGKGTVLYKWLGRDSSIFLEWYDNEELTGNPVDSVGPDETGDKDFYAKWFDLKRPPIDPTDSCYEISDVAELYGFSALVNGEFAEGEKRLDDVCGKLTQDIVVNKNVLKENGTLDSAREEEFFPWNTINLYNGLFDGQGHTISGLYAFEAIFSARAPGAFVTNVTIRNLKVKDTFVYGMLDAAGIISPNEEFDASIEIDNTHFDGAIYVDEYASYVGGLVSNASYVLIIKNSSHRGIISVPDGEGIVGGLVGHTDVFTILLQNSNEGRIEGGDEVGGLVGEATAHFFIANNYNLADIVCSECDANGLIGGYSYYGEALTKRPTQSFVLNNYSKGLISGSSGVWLKNYNVTFENNYYLTGTRSRDSIGTEVEALDFANGTVATALYNYVQNDAAGIEIVGGATGDKWIQGSKYPIFFENETRSVIRLREYDEHKPLPTIALLYTPGQTLPLPTPTAKGYDFLGWYYDSNLITEIPATASGNFVIAPKWQKHVSSSSIASSSSVAPPGPANTSSSVAASSSSEEKISSSSPEVNSSSAMSSSSVKSSSSRAKSSSSVKSSSSSAKAKSSSSKAKSSSSKAKSSSSKAKSSSSKGKDAIVAAAQVPQFMLTAVGREIQVAGARVGSAYAVLDMQGRVIAKGRVDATDFSVHMDRSATYLMRIGNQTQRVKVGSRQ